ncbi:hypothetical protein IDSA_11720 [Pseudidiomarina salinarum]|uniref:Tetratricopeptide repeat protein n=1 Tax=Pseudidiomarina salinarum TaxID=435908 RepID=A0A094IW88_9GAMM|nr:tetratricopeptide repeat protein [Pseudidiomarina salinarum]KFZ30114.1 hypothetical protein IDSA_11720 [Pseudidiomarina salinarum]RUO68235.1 tetratricopeptide repeat-containing protein [Pseudidiomarina salinarum]
MGRVLMLLLMVAAGGCATTGSPGQDPTNQSSLKAAELAYRQGDLHLAEGLWREIVGDEDDLSPGWCYLGHISFRQHRYEEALSSYQQCLDFRQQQPAIWRNMAALRLRQATELLLTGTAYLSDSGDTGEQQRFNREYRKLLQQLMVLQQVDSRLLQDLAHVPE